MEPFRFYNHAEVNEKKERRRRKERETATAEPASLKLPLPISQLSSGDTVLAITAMVSDRAEYTLFPEPRDHPLGRLDPIAEISQVEVLSLNKVESGQETEVGAMMQVPSHLGLGGSHGAFTCDFLFTDVAHSVTCR